MIELYKRLRREIKERGSQMQIGCEVGASEPFLSYLTFSDSRYTQQYYYGKPVPAYGYLYHEYLNNFAGNNCGSESLNCMDNPSNLAFRIANSFVSGNMISLILSHQGEIYWGWSHGEEERLPNREEIIALVRNLNSWRTGFGKPYLYTGRMMKPVKVQDVDSYTLLRRDGTTTEYQSVLTTKWRSQEGQEAQIFVNFLDKKQTFTIDYDKECTLVMTAEGQSSKMVSPGEEIEIEPFSAIMVTF